MKEKIIVFPDFKKEKKINFFPNFEKILLHWHTRLRENFNFFGCGFESRYIFYYL